MPGGKGIQERTQRALRIIVLLLSGCSARAGMYCQQDGDCRTGLICVRPPADAAASDGGTFGICEPARRGRGEVCLWSSECQPPLSCSNTVGVFTGDGRHGRCEAPLDGGAEPDLGGDLAAADDGGVDGGDGGSTDAALDGG